MKKLFPLLLLFSCAFESDEIYNVDVPEPDGSDVVINLNTANDTIYFLDRAEFHFTIDSKGRQVLSHRVTVDGKIVESGGYQTNIAFAVYASQVGLGYRKLKVEYTLKSGTNSLAEAYGTETLTVSKELVLDVDAPVTSIILRQLDTRDGRLKVTWQKCRGRNFHRYWLVKT